MSPASIVAWTSLVCKPWSLITLLSRRAAWLRIPCRSLDQGAPTKKFREVSITVLLAAVLVAGTGQINPRLAAAAPNRPNVLIIVTDDQREGLEYMPYTRRLLKRGGRTFPHAFATTPLCCPSRASIFTGRYTHNHGVTSNRTADELDHETTLQYYLQQAGYRTGIFGKFLNKWSRGQTSPPFFSSWAVNAGGNYYDVRFNINGDFRRVHKYSTTFIGSQAVRFLSEANRQADSQPWLMYVTPTAPHSSYIAEPKYVDAPVAAWDGTPAVFEEDRSDKPSYVQRRGVTFEQGAEVREKQFRTLMSVDDLVERLFDSLKALDELDNTVAFYLSDNGYMWGEHGLSNKSAPYTESIRVPLLARWPGHIEPGTRDDRLVANIDVAPTVLDAVGLRPSQDEPVDGRSLLDQSWIRTRLLTEGQYHPKFEIPAWASLRTGSYQYVEYYGPDGKTLQFTEGYDLASDPHQLDNLLGGSLPGIVPPRLSSLGATLAEDRRCAGSTCP
jgi:arylsulfatase A-like enzyme